MLDGDVQAAHAERLREQLHRGEERPLLTANHVVDSTEVPTGQRSHLAATQSET